MPEAKVRAIFARAGQRHADDRFLFNFAAAVLHAGNGDYTIIRPAALLIIERYNLAEERRAS
jgi:hypothetical protein